MLVKYRKLFYSVLLYNWEYMDINITLFHITPCITSRVGDPGIDIWFSGWYRVRYGKGYVYSKIVYLITYQTQIYIFLKSFEGLIWIYISAHQIHIVILWSKLAKVDDTGIVRYL